MVLESVRPIREVRHPVTGDKFGMLYATQGRVRVLSVQDDGAIAEITHNCEGIVVGARLRAYQAEPVPLARRRQRRRGFNQAQMLADWLGRRLQLPVHGDWLQRRLDTPAQQGLDAATRKRNLRQAFALDAGAELAGRHLALVDDVLTTGATAGILARLLRRAGAARVDVYCLARTPRPGDG